MEGGEAVELEGADDIGLVLGRLYTWKEATLGESKSGLGEGPQGICPDGWTVPTNEDWEALAKTLSGEEHPFSGYEPAPASQLLRTAVIRLLLECNRKRF